MTMASEFELKYRAGEAVHSQIRGDFSGPWREIPMATTYYDTPEGVLSHNRWTLRHRREGERDVCTLKTPSPDGARGEWECDCPEILRALPVLAAGSGRLELMELASRGLVAVCGAEFTRWALDLEEADFTAELALDRGILRSGSRQIPLCEVELELKSGSREALMAFGEEFAARYGLQTEEKSKFARAKALSRED